MSATYQPDDSAIPQFPWNITFLSQRDVALQIPIDYIIAPGVSLTAACFPNHVYETTATVKCVSNLLAVGFRRLVVDIYWDALRRSWSLCPVQLPDSSTPPTTTENGAAATASKMTTTKTVGSGLTVGTRAGSTTSVSLPFSGGSSLPQPDGSTSVAGSTSLREIWARQITSTSDSASSSASVSGSSLESGSGTTGIPSTASLAAPTASTSTGFPITMSAPSSSISSTTNAMSTSTTNLPTTMISMLPSSPGSGFAVYKTGQYTCSTGADLSLLMNMFEDFFDSTNTNVAAVLKYIIFNIHAAASGLDPDGPASQPTTAEMPSDSELLGSQMRVQMDGYLFTPSMLLKDRSNLNSTWLMASNITQPDPAYYKVQLKKDDTAFTQNGWPSESYLIFTDFDRVLIGSGYVDPQMSSYDFATDNANMFTPMGGAGPANISVVRPVTDLDISATGAITSGCMFNPQHPVLDPTTNTSWTSSTAPLYPLAGLSNTTACGISPLLNSTLNSTSADQNPLPYQKYAYATIWSWASSQPAVSPTNPYFRCAALSIQHTGRWIVRDCSEQHRSACRVGNQPYAWSISSQTASYTGANDLCSGGAAFAVPRTPLENDYLLAALVNVTSSARAATARDLLAAPLASDPLVWINFNCLDVQSCWVTGTTSTCPYDSATASLERTIVVPAVAAVVVIVLAVLTVVAKCAGNRREGKRRRKGKGRGGVWPFEGVPS